MVNPASSTRRVTIVMYHFVRDLRRSRYPEIKGLDTAEFIGQLDYIQKHYNPVRMEEVITAVRDPAAKLPERAILLTFDDGYSDHFNVVFPLLDRYRIQGSFFPPARAILERSVLDVNKIHFLLASVPQKARIIAAMDAQILANTGKYDLQPPEYYRQTYAHANRYDTAEVIHIKRVLQKALPEALRAEIVDALFREFVSSDEIAFAQELYATPEQLQCMLRQGMHIGSHSYDHYWLNTLDPPKQEQEVIRSKEFLKDLGCDMDNWVMCYPYGGYNASLTEILSRHGCRVGLSVEVDIAEIGRHDALALPRIDTNDLPRQADATPVEWTQRA